MTTLQAVLGIIGTGLLWVVLVGTLWRRHHREWMFFPVFVASIVAYALLVTFWPQLHTPEVYLVKEALGHLVRLLMALELAVRIFRAFPGAMATLRRVLVIVLAVTLAVVMTGVPAESTYQAFMRDFQTRVLNAAIWLFTAIAALILWYRLPVPRFQKAILLSYVPYLLVFTVFMDRLGRLGWQKGLVFIYINQLAYLALLAFWSYVAWQPKAGASAADHEELPEQRLLH